MDKATHSRPAGAAADKSSEPHSTDAARRITEATRDAEAEKMSRLRALRLQKENTERLAAEVRKARRQMRAP